MQAANHDIHHRLEASRPQNQTHSQVQRQISTPQSSSSTELMSTSRFAPNLQTSQSRPGSSSQSQQGRPGSSSHLQQGVRPGSSSHSQQGRPGSSSHSQQGVRIGSGNVRIQILTIILAIHFLKKSFEKMNFQFFFSEVITSDSFSSEKSSPYSSSYSNECGCLYVTKTAAGLDKKA